MEQIPFDLPMEDDPLQLNRFHADTRNLLDECYRHTLVGSVNRVNGLGSIIMHLAMEMKELYIPSSLRKIGNICNMPDQQLLRRFIDENLYLIHIQHIKVTDKYVLAYCTPRWLRAFFFDPNRSRSFYSTSRIIEKCQAAVKSVLDPNHDIHCMALIPFFTPTIYGDIAIGKISNATRLLESVRNGSNSNELLDFLGYLSEICWLDVNFGDVIQKALAIEIAQWVCITLVG
jgi:hypothetical protein